MQRRWARQVTAALVSSATAFGAGTPYPSFAQGLPPLRAAAPSQAPGAPALGQPAGDPPARVGRLAQLSGTVSYHLAGADRWDAAAVNLPVAAGSALWTEPGAKAGIEVTGTRVGMDQSTELDVAQLDERSLILSLPQGAVCIHAPRDPAPGEQLQVQTPRGTVSLLRAGRYEVVAGDTQHPTLATVVEGEADFAPPTGPTPATPSPAAASHAGPNQAVTANGDGQSTPVQAVVGPAQHDAFLTACLAADQPPRPRTVQVPDTVERMTGGEALYAVGDWASVPEYGAVWYPPADPGFVPYRQGRWSYVSPWGWTWVDDAPWGFAPSHYGRWVQVDSRWGWIPGGGVGAPGYAVPAYPVYAPAVVSFLAGAAVGALTATALERGSVGWVPLGPREPYFPPYRASDAYVRNLNVTHVQNVTTVVNSYHTVLNGGGLNNNGRGGFGQGAAYPGGALVNRAGATSVPASAMAGSQNLATLARPVPPGAIPQSAALAARPPIRPTQATLGITPTVARQYNLPPQGARPSAPGPALRGGVAAPAQSGPEIRQPGIGRAGVALGAAAAGGLAGAALARPGIMPNLREPSALQRPAGVAPEAAVPGRPQAGPAPQVIRPGQPEAARAPEARAPEARAPEARAPGPRPEQPAIREARPAAPPRAMPQVQAPAARPAAPPLMRAPPQRPAAPPPRAAMPPRPQPHPEPRPEARPAPPARSAPAARPAPERGGPRERP